jgi:large subunit ribosomal protein L25
LRREGRIPGIVYGRGLSTIAVKVDQREVERILHSDTGRNTIFKLNVDESSRDVIIKDLQRDPVKDDLLHVDFQVIAMDQVMTFEVPIEAVGTPLGVRSGGGILDIVLRTIEIECLPADLIDHIRVDVADMNIGDSLRVGQLQVDEKRIKVLSDPDLVVINMAAPHLEKVEEAPAVEAAAEPEVIKKGKAEEEAGE